jgi:molybdopterin molybdotransferase
MVQLTPDALAFGEDLLTVDALLARFAEQIACVAGVEMVPLMAAHKRVLAEDLLAPLPLPGFTNSAVDGYAVAFARLNTDQDTQLPIVGRIAAGGGYEGRNEAGAVRIFTGAMMPDGTDTVFMQEDVRLSDDGQSVILPKGLKRGANCRLIGEDLPLGARALAAGSLLGPSELALASALGLSQLPVRRPLRVAVFSTGNEVVEPGVPLKAGQLYDANRLMLISILSGWGLQVTDLGILPDQRDQIGKALIAAAHDHDLILTSGGVSTGEEDHVKAALKDQGRLDLWRVGIKPGRPLVVGQLGASCLFVGLPGNPVAVFVTLTALVRALVAAMRGERYIPPRHFIVRIGFDYRKKQGRREFVRVSLTSGADGQFEAHKHPQDGAGVITSLTETDGFLVLPDEATRIEKGTFVSFVSYAAVLA